MRSLTFYFLFCSLQSPLQLCLRHQQRCLTGTRVAVWGRVCAMLGADCKKGLTAVRAVAAKYRMTNKPAPDAPSPYVEMILQPFRYFTVLYRTLRLFNVFLLSHQCAYSQRVMFVIIFAPEFFWIGTNLCLSHSL